MDLVTPFGAQISCKPKYEARLHHSGKKMRPGIFIGYVLRTGGGWSGDLLIAECEDFENLPTQISTSNVSSTRKSHTKESCCFNAQTNLSNSSIFFNLHAAKCPPGETQSKMKKNNTTPFYEEKAVNNNGA